MIKIGDSYFNESQIAAIQPSTTGMHADVYLLRGAVISVDVERDDLQELLEDAGLLTSGFGVDVFTFAPGENQELWLAYEDGYLFAAKDKNGQVFAYKLKPKKRGAEWALSNGDLEARRLHGDFDCLSFDDDEPLDLVELFSFRDAGEDEGGFDGED